MMNDNNTEDSQIMITNLNNNDSVNETINAVLSQTTNNSSKINARQNKRRQSGENEDDKQKKKKYNVILNNIHDAYSR